MGVIVFNVKQPPPDVTQAEMLKDELNVFKF